MNVLSVWRIVFTKGKYLFYAFLVAVLFYGFNVLISNYKTLSSYYSSFGFFGTLKFFSLLFIGFSGTIKFHSFITLVIVSVLLGMLFSITLYKIKISQKNDVKKVGIFSSIGIFLAALAPGCAACGLGLAPLLGISSAFLLALPLDGLELSILAILILSFSTWKTSKGLLECDSCKIQLKKQNVNKNERRTK
jgi:hypothetical protein